MRTHPVGSTWRRWDLHFHTPASFDYKDKSVTAQRLVDGLLAAGVEVVAVTDHHRIDPTVIEDMRAYAGDRLTVLPGLELRSDLGGHEVVHYVGIFSEGWDVVELWTKLQGKLDLSPADVAKKGNDRFYVPFREGASQIRELGGFVTVHAGRKTNSIENLSNADLVKRAVKEDLAREYIDAFEVGQVQDADDYRRIVFPSIGFERPMVMGSDNHDIDAYAVKAPMWIRAEPAFLGLRQLLTEPESRAYLGNQPPLLERVRQSATKYMASISFRSTYPNASPSWFSGAVPLNPGLIAVIGRKGGGKSALTDILALVGNSRMSAYYTFLCKEKFLAPKARLGAMFKATVTWESGATPAKALDESADPLSPESVKYIPQNYLEAICTEVQRSVDSKFDQELRQVIFSHVGEADRLGKSTLGELLAYRTAETESRCGDLLAELAPCNSSIVELEHMAEPETKLSLQAQLRARQAEIEAYDKAKPPEVRPPQQDPATQAASSAILASVGEVQEGIDQVSRLVEQDRAADRTSTAKIAAATKLKKRVENLRQQFEAFLREGSGDAALLGVDINSLVNLQVNLDRVDAIESESARAQTGARAQLDAGVEGSHAAELAALTEKLCQLRMQLDQPARMYQNYLQALGEWQQGRVALLGSPDQSDSLEGVASRLAGLETVPRRLEEAIGRRAAITTAVFEQKLGLLSDYRALFAPVQRFIDDDPVARQHRSLQFDASIVSDGFADAFLAQINQGRKGSFQGDKEGHEVVGRLVDVASYESAAAALAFAESVMEHLQVDHGDPAQSPTRVKDQLRSGRTAAKLYDYIFGLEYLRPRFELKWEGKRLDQLSPGERGSLLLVFYLLIDRRDVPLIIDQPEENLDNETVTEMLVPALKAARQRRQIIIVTHNPNLAVVCDADQVIHASLDRTNANLITYTAGAIENPSITQLIVDVLEGTKPAFDVRDAKYEVLEA